MSTTTRTFRLIYLFSIWLSILHLLFTKVDALKYSLSRKKIVDNNNLGRSRRRLSLLMDSFVDPIISDDYFYAILYVGSPSGQRVEMALDTGSGLPYFACLSTCVHCGKHDDIPYNINNSTSFNWIKCSHNLCINSNCNNNNICEWTQRYVDKSSISAKVGSDLMSFYKYPYLPSLINKTKRYNNNFGIIRNEKKLRLVFGCSEREANTIFRQGADGVMGLSMHKRSFVDQLFNNNNNNNNNNNDNLFLGLKQFAHCFGIKTGGLLLFGSNEINDLINKFNIKLKWTKFITKNGGHGWYRVKTVGFTVDLKQTSKDTDTATNNITYKSLNVNYASNLNSGYKGSVIDTGSSTLSMPRQAATNIMKSILNIVNSNTGDDDKFEWASDPTKNYDFFLQWNGKKNFDKNDYILFIAKYIKYFPDVIMLWEGIDGNPLQFNISVRSYLLFKLPHFCLDLFGDTPSILVGSNVMINKFMVYDRDNMKLGVSDLNCDDLIYQADDNSNNNHNNINTSNDNDINKDQKVPINIVTPAPIPTPKPVIVETTKPIKDMGQVIDNPLKPEREEEPTIFIKSSPITPMSIIIYIIVIIIGIFIISMIWKKCKNNNNYNRNDVKYKPVSSTDLLNNNSSSNIHQQPNHRKKRKTKPQQQPSSSSYIINQSVSDRISHIDLDMLSTTTPTQSFTSKQHQTKRQSNDK